MRATGDMVRQRALAALYGVRHARGRRTAALCASSFASELPQRNLDCCTVPCACLGDLCLPSAQHYVGRHNAFTVLPCWWRRTTLFMCGAVYSLARRLYSSICLLLYSSTMARGYPGVLPCRTWRCWRLLSDGSARRHPFLLPGINGGILFFSFSGGVPPPLW